jgi:presequence protease
MTYHADSHNPGLTPGKDIGAYRIEKIVFLEEMDAFLYQLVHVPTQAKHIHISNKDTENAFAVGFKTVPADSTGVAHILEHTVLCGSKKFPVRDPFFSMLKRSLNTFMNAFTASDWTMYPFSTQNRQDFRNLMDVYLDAVFFPNIDELSFKQEGHRLEIEPDENGSGDFHLVYKGVVYNEMKGAMSSPYQVLVRSLMHALYPDTTYHHNSGGDPREIPRLTHDQLKTFHQRHYHPSNAFFYTYGNLPLKDHLEFIEKKALSCFQEIDPDTRVPSQPRWQQEKTVEYAYALGKNEAPEKKVQAGVAWLSADIQDTFDVLSLQLLERILLGNAASPLRKALLDSGLGTALSDGTGYDHDNRDTLFACGLKDVKKEDTGNIRALIFETLEDLVTGGIDGELIESAIHQLEFHHKEVTNTPYPYGIQLVMSFAGSWFHGADPGRVLQFDDDIAAIREKVAQGGFFESLIQKYFLNNFHRTTFSLVPDPLMEERDRARVMEELNRTKAGLSSESIDKIRSDQESLQQLQDSLEDPSCLPTLAISDIPPDITRVEEIKIPGTDRLFAYHQPTSGILYFSGVLNIESLPTELLSMIPLFGYMYTKIGTRKHDYVRMARLMDAHTGGIFVSAHARTSLKTKSCIPFLSLDGKCLNRNMDRLFDILEELTKDFFPGDLSRIKTLLLQYQAGLEAGIVQNGHRLAMSLASRNFSETQKKEELWHGVHQLLALKELTSDLSEENLKAFSEKLLRIKERVWVKDNFKTALVGEDEAVHSAISRSGSIITALHRKALPQKDESPQECETFLPWEGWSTSSAVSFVASSFPTPSLGHKDAPILFVASKLLRSMYLHREIREKGGAYGGFALYNPEDGIFSLASYRDPHIANTLKVFEGVEDFLNSGSYNDEDIKEAILQACSEIDKPDSPGTRGKKAFFRKTIGLTDEDRTAFKEGILAVNRKKVSDLAAAYFNPDKTKRAVAVISGDAQLLEACRKLDRPLEIHKI